VVFLRWLAAVFISIAFAVGAAHPRIVEILVEVGVGFAALAFMFSVKALGIMSREFSKARRIRNTIPRRAGERSDLGTRSRCGPGPLLRRNGGSEFLKEQ
jgi:hypothetical protein